MANRLRKNISLLQFLATCNKKQRDLILNNLTDSQVLSICECVDNVLRGNVPLDEPIVKKLSRKRAQFARIRNKGLPLKERKRVIVQTGGFLPSLLIPVLSIASGLIGDLIRR